MKKLFIALSVSAALSLPLCTYAQDRDDHREDRDHHGRYYDKRHHDYHEWNDREDRAWHMYWEERHRPYVAWDRANERERDEYWDWRHHHSDADLHIEIGR